PSDHTSSQPHSHSSSSWPGRGGVSVVRHLRSSSSCLKDPRHRPDQSDDGDGREGGHGQAESAHRFPDDIVDYAVRSAD
ncbi:MAG: hypothetical protein P8015_18320, partial [Acidihalobacter sp.]